MTEDLQEILLNSDTLGKRVSEIGEEVSRHYGAEEILLITLLDGAIVFTADLIRSLCNPITLDCIRVSSYGSSATPETAPRILENTRSDVDGRHVLLVDDILDTGKTLRTVIKKLEAMQPCHISTCVLLSKKARRQYDIPADYVGFEIPNEFVVGYGLDHAEKYRNLPHIGVLKELAVSSE